MSIVIESHLQLKPLTESDWAAEVYPPQDLGVPVSECIAVEVSEIYWHLAAVVHCPTGRVLWAETGEGIPPIPDGFGPAVLTLARLIN